MSRARDVWVWAECRSGSLAAVSLELLGKARALAQTLDGGVAAVLIGSGVETLAGEVIAYGADKVFLAEDPRLELYQSGACARILADLIEEYQPEVLLIGGTRVGKDLAPRVAARVETGLTAHCVDLYMEEIEGRPQLVQVVPGWGGGMMIKILCPERRPQMATVTPGVLETPPRDDGRHGEVVRVDVKVEDSDFRARTTGIVDDRAASPLESADVVVAVGWGMSAVGGPEPGRRLAGILDGALAGTRPAADKGWISPDALIGQSGKTVKPRLFISLGASGAPHYTTGFLKSKTILAVDRNPQAPIFDACDVGIVGDLKDVLPVLEEELRSAVR